MPIRRRHRIGDYLVRDDITGFIRYQSETTRDYLGALTKTSDADPIQPQLFARPVNDPQPVPIYSPDSGLPPTYTAYIPDVGDTTVPTPFGPATHLFDVGIGQMAVGNSFLVR